MGIHELFNHKYVILVYLLHIFYWLSYNEYSLMLLFVMSCEFNFRN